ncbi:MAG: hypothetical protein EHM58_10865 [Ignavibacteriae bacterium]|nr:MAG: hypothetical protein EHM58_10865 [Ignavibacteriota bacterium]
MQKIVTLYLTALIFIIPEILLSQTSYDETAVPRIDGKIEHSEWRDAKVLDRFYVTIPKTTENYYDSTIVYIKQTNDALYMAFKYWPKGNVISKSLVRDRSTEEENEFFILLDMENKGQNGYFFSFSFLNNQRDAIIFNERNQSSEWDWVWECKSTIHSEAKNGKPGFIETEVKIPVEKMQNKNTKQIGVELQLFAYKPDGTSYWYSNDPNMELLSLKSTYKLDLVKPFKEKLALDVSISPFVVGTKFNDFKYRGAIGGDLYLGYEKHKLKGTVFTDQSTLEADPFRFSFYNRPIFLQEKRPFFSKDLDIYRSNINVFYTRAIDSIDYGVNYTFRSDKLKAGVIYVNEPKYNRVDSIEQSKSYFAARPTFVFPGFNAGATFLYMKNKVTDVEEKVFSVDGKINLPSRFRFLPQYIRSYRNGIAGNAYSAYLYYEFDNTGGPYCDISYTRYDKDFNVSTAFTDFGNNYHSVFVSGGYNFRRNTTTFSDINVNAGYSSSKDLTSGFAYSEGVNASVYYKVNGWLSLNHFIEYNRPNNRDQNTGELIDKKHTNILMDNNLKILYGSHALYLGYYTGKYFGTFLKNPYATLDLSITNRLSLNLSYTYQELFDVKQTIYRAKLDYKIMDKLYLRSFFQKDTYNDLALWNTLLQYEFFAGSNAYFVINLEGPKLQNTRRYFKIGYEFTF